MLYTNSNNIVTESENAVAQTTLIPYGTHTWPCVVLQHFKTGIKRLDPFIYASPMNDLTWLKFVAFQDLKQLFSMFSFGGILVLT